MSKTTLTLITLAVAGMFAGLALCAVALLVPPPNFSPKTVTVSSGTNITQAAQKLASRDIIIHPLSVTIALKLSGDKITAGRYKFHEPESPLTVSRRLTDGDFRTNQMEVVIPEGFTREQIADRLENKLGDDFSHQAFLSATQNKEGYLFPDTYRVSSGMSEREIAQVLERNFRQQIANLQSAITNFPYSKAEVMKMASLVETEAADYETRRRVAGVLWERFDRGTPLQADAVFAYLLDKTSAELTQADLDTDSPYNLYTNTGLPPTPIANPGLAAIRATINPIRTDNLYYLTGDNGEFYFAETLEEHNRNKRKYLN